MHESEVQRVASGLRLVLERAASSMCVNAIMLSGGLDTGISAFLVRDQGPIALTVSLHGSESPDAHYAARLAHILGLKHEVLIVEPEEAMNLMQDVIRILRTFDPMEVINSLAIYIGLRRLKELGMSRALTGDGSDELFAGYSYMWEMAPSDLGKYIEELTSHWSFSSINLSKYLRMEVFSIFLEEEVVKYAVKIPAELKVRKVGDKVVGKYILRKAFQGILPDWLIWREKHPIEVGSGFTYLRRMINMMIDEGDFKNEIEEIRSVDHVTINSKEQLYCYKVYRSIFGTPRPSTGRSCPYCTSDVVPDTRYCRVCGAYPI